MKTGRRWPSLRRYQNPMNWDTERGNLPVDACHGLEVMAWTIRSSLLALLWYRFLTTHLGFQSESMRHNLDAPTRFNPTPPALELSRKRTAPKCQRGHKTEAGTNTHSFSCELLLNALTYSCLFASCVCLNISRHDTVWTRSRIPYPSKRQYV